MAYAERSYQLCVVMRQCRGEVSDADAHTPKRSSRHVTSTQQCSQCAFSHSRMLQKSFHTQPLLASTSAGCHQCIQCSCTNGTMHYINNYVILQIVLYLRNVQEVCTVQWWSYFPGWGQRACVHGSFAIPRPAMRPAHGYQRYESAGNAAASPQWWTQPWMSNCMCISLATAAGT